MPLQQNLAIISALLGFQASAERADPNAGWALRPLELPSVPELADSATPIDGFIGTEAGIRAGRRTLIRRVTFDLTGLPPTPGEVQRFIDDPSPEPAAFAKVVDRLLASPRYGERWARHWMDAVRYAETHGHDEDAVRENAWPYRDYLIRAFNDDKPYADFVKQQVAGDVLFPDDPWATVATAFLACGPWDESSQMGIQDGTTDKLVAQYLDRDEMITATMSTFTSTTAHCSRCHDHKFDPIPAADYYALQAVFAGVDRVDRPYDADPELKRRRDVLLDQQARLARDELPEGLDESDFRQWVDRYQTNASRWPALRLIEAISEGGATVEKLGDGSVRFGGERPERDTYTFRGTVPVERVSAVVVEAMLDEGLHKGGPGRQDNGNLHLSEVEIRIGDKVLPIARAESDFDQEGWTIAHAIDGNEKTAWGVFPQIGTAHRAIFVLQEPAAIAPGGTISVVLKQQHGGGHLIGRPRVTVTAETAPILPAAFRPTIGQVLAKAEAARTSDEQRQLALVYWREHVDAELAELQKPLHVYAVATHWDKKGNFTPADGPRPIHLLDRGDIHSPGEPAAPGALSCLPLPFDIRDPNDEGARRAALAEWLGHHDNVLTWRSIANRVWAHHFGRGIVATPNDFGAMGARPSHPELLDWLAYQLRANNGSLKWMHREICTCATYAAAASPFVTPRRLDAESIRDAVLQLSGKLDLTMGGPSARQFHSSKGVHVTPILDYLGFDPDDPANFRRSVYRFVFRTVPDPLMAALDCPDASQLAPGREESVTSLQALAMLNNRFLVRQCEHIAARLEGERDNLGEQIGRLFELAYSRAPSDSEIAAVGGYATAHGLANACRVIINSSEFVFVQ